MLTARSYDSFYDDVSIPQDVTLSSTFTRLPSVASEVSHSIYSPTIGDAESGRVLPLPEPIYDTPTRRARPPRSLPPRPVHLPRRLSITSSMQYAEGFSTLDILIDVPIVSQEEAERNASQDWAPRSKGTWDKLLDFVASLYTNTRRLLFALFIIMIATFICSIVGIILVKRK
ncbi:hypothetical protein BDN72DRAFT_845390 [Pluteus cervinus]|uniref:Uncharacterized protein n=1 Tax=Pluteus cervinus TaxID=181527 RepID=A0ACD3AJ09_9AGAR|nr:hypothetical protein BDN72DRAFT_845390 [Pluteus cervinus]